MLVMAPFGALFLLIGLVAIAIDPDDLVSGWAPFYLAPVFCGLFFLTPAMFAFLRKQAEPAAVATHTTQRSRTSETPQAQPLGRSTENIVMGFFGSMFIIMAIASVLTVIAIVVLIFILLELLSQIGVDLWNGIQ